MIYVDSSVVLAQLLAEDRYPDAHFWDAGPLISSRLLEHEVWTRINARGLGPSLAEDVRLLLARLAFLELVPPVLARALEPFAKPVRTLDALHLSTALVLRERRAQDIAFATHDAQQATAARALGFQVVGVKGA